MALTDRTLVFVYATFAILGRVGYYIDSPLWLDYFKTNNTGNASTIFPPNSTEADDTRQINAYFLLISQCLVSTTFFGLALGLTALWQPHKITEFDRTYPKKNFAIIGVSQGLSSILFNFGISGSRTAPYLQAVLSNFNIPIQFTVRFLVLRKRPTCVKLSCAALVMVAEFVCLIPKIFPSLESSKTHHEEGGGSGAAGVLWPMCLVASQIPFALANTVMERSVKNSDKSSTDTKRLNLVFFLFWWYLCVTITCVLFWWVDLIPGFGTSNGLSDFGEKMWFNLQCLFGQADCDGAVVALGWSNFAISIIASYAFASLMRVSEGANFLIIVLTIRTPLLFLFWALFEEHPFRWHPEAHLSTWLSLGAIVFMLPAVYIYDRAPPEKDLSTDHEPLDDDDDDERAGLLGRDSQSGYGSYMPAHERNYVINQGNLGDDDVIDNSRPADA